MAVVQSPLFNLIRNSMGDVTFQRGRFNAIVMKSKIVDPDYPNSTGQQNAQAAFLYAVDNWGSIDQELRDGWNRYGKTLMTRKDFGSGIMGGRLAFIQCWSLARMIAIRTGLYVPAAFSYPTVKGYLHNPITKAVDYNGGSSAGIQWHYKNENPFRLNAYWRRSLPLNPTVNRYTHPFYYDLGGITDPDPSGTTIQRLSYDSALIGKIVFVIHSFLPFDEPLQYGFRVITRHIIQSP